MSSILPGAGSVNAAPGAAGSNPSISLLPSSADAMNGETLERKVTIISPLGFHMRPQKAFAELAQQFQSTITLIKDDRRVNGKSPFELLLMSVPHGTEVTIQASGGDAKEALEALAEVLATTFPEDEPDPPLPKKG